MLKDPHSPFDEEDLIHRDLVCDLDMRQLKLCEEMKMSMLIETKQGI